MSVCLPSVCRCLWRPEEGLRSPETRVIGTCELTNMAAGK